jgi:polar amino acid transport system substrate-binding protein
MRKAALALLLPLALLALVAAGCGGGKSASTTGSTATTGTVPAARTATSAPCSRPNLNLLSKGVLTVGTDNPAYPPWFGGGTTKGSKWQINDPSTGKGFESAVTYAVAKHMGLTPKQVTWKYVPFNRIFAPGSKPFDVAVNQVSITPARAKVVTFSDPYYDQNQAIVVLKGSDIAKVTTVDGLKGYKLGAQLGTTSYDYIKSHIKPLSSPAVFPQNAGAIQALKNGQIDGLVVDLPTAFYVTAVQVPNGTILGQFPAVPGGEHFGMVLAKGNTLAPCVDRALAALKANGTLEKIQQQWLAKATGAPVLK